MADIIRHVLKLSKVAVIGMARKNGIERTNNIVAFSSETNNAYAAKATARYGTIVRGKIPVTIKPNKTSWLTKTQLSFDVFNIF